MAVHSGITRFTLTVIFSGCGIGKHITCYYLICIARLNFQIVYIQFHNQAESQHVCHDIPQEQLCHCPKLCNGRVEPG